MESLAFLAGVVVGLFLAFEVFAKTERPVDNEWEDRIE